MQDTIYLLGGHDLEMKEILAILAENGRRFIDRQLHWGAKLSDYKDVLNDEDLFIGIELTQDVQPPKFYEIIDHHNENSSRLSSLEQVALKIGILLNDRQRLIAANDSGYIPAMIALGASPEEIDEIRRLDREAQGVSVIDEQLAQASIKSHLTKIGEVTVIKSLTDHFSPITDRLFPSTQLIIYTDRKLTYYGTGAGNLHLNFEELTRANKIYYGGGPNGFFGIKQDALTQAELEAAKSKIIKVVNQD